MSLLINESYANPSKALWASSTNPVIAGAVTAGEFITSPGGDMVVVDASGNTALRIATGATPSPAYLQTSTSLYFGQVGQGLVNSYLTPSTAGANTDLLRIGGTVDTLALKLANTGGAAVIGSGTLASGTVTIATTASDVNSYIMITRTAINGSTAVGELRVSNKSANSFTVVSATPASPTTTETGDVSSFDWMIINPA